MERATSWRKRFIELAMELRRLAGKPAQDFKDTPDMPVSMTFHVDDVLFEVVHFGDQTESPDQFLLQCRFGRVPLNDAAAVLEEALTMSHGMARNNAGMFALDTQANELVCSSFQTLDGVEPQQLAGGVAQIAALARQWRSAHSVVLH